MSVTDNPLKRLFNVFAKEIAAWLLNAEVQTVSDPLNVEISARNLLVDRVRKVKTTRRSKKWLVILLKKMS